MTPEGIIKAKVKKVLAKYGDELDAFWPVQNGMGTPALDCIICYRDHHAAIETKAGDKQMTPRQKITADRLSLAGSAVFLINEETGTGVLSRWLDSVQWRNL